VDRAACAGEFIEPHMPPPAHHELWFSKRWICAPRRRHCGELAPKAGPRLSMTLAWGGIRERVSVEERAIISP